MGAVEARRTETALAQTRPAGVHTRPRSARAVYQHFAVLSAIKRARDSSLSTRLRSAPARRRNCAYAHNFHQVSEITHDPIQPDGGASPKVPAEHAHEAVRNAGAHRPDSLQDLLSPLADKSLPNVATTERTTAVDTSYTIPETKIISHAPGWTVFSNLYMSNGTVFIVTSRPNSIPDILMITSTGLPAENTPENIAARIPTSDDMAIITPEEARDMWGGDAGSVRSMFYVDIQIVLIPPFQSA